jgi:hypothetical protein
MLAYRSSDSRLATEEIRDISAITSGLSKAIVSCQAHSNAAN